MTIVHKAIDRDPAHRYAAAAEFAADLQRFLDDEPIHARRVTPAERLLRWCRHNPAVAGLLAAVAVLLVGVATVSATAAFRIAGARDEATRNAREALGAKENESAQRKLAEAKARESRQRLVRLHVANGERLLDEGDLFGALPWLTEALHLDKAERPRRKRTAPRLAAVLAQAPRLAQVWRHEQEVEYATFSPDGRRVVTASRDHTARVWDAVTGEAITPPLRHGRHRLEGRVQSGRPPRGHCQPGRDGPGVGRAAADSPFPPPCRIGAPCWMPRSARTAVGWSRGAPTGWRGCGTLPLANHSPRP